MRTLLQINVTANSGSHGRIAEEIGQLVMKEGWRSVIAYGRKENTSQSELLPIGSYMGVLEHVFESRIWDNHGLASRLATREFIRQIEDLRPDIIHLHNIHGYYINYRLLFEYLNNKSIPVVWTLHDCWSFTGHCSHFITAKCDKWKTNCRECPLKGDYPRSFVDFSKRNYNLKKRLFVANNNLHLVAVSDWLADLVNQSFFVNEDIRVINNGIDLDKFKPTNAERRSKYCILGVSSAWLEKKGLFDFYRLREILPIEQFDIVLVGVSKSQIKRLPDGIVGIERTESVDVLRKFYSMADVYVNPSYVDTFPTVNLEALACGTPVVTYKTGGSPETISNETGIIVEQGNINELAKAVDAICQSDRNRYRQDCRSRAVHCFDKNEKYKEYLNLYQSLL